MSFEFWAVTVCRQNTGSHMMDSGGSSGRHWQQPAEVETEPGLKIGRSGEYLPVDLLPESQLARLRAEEWTEREIWFGGKQVPAIFVSRDFDAQPGDFVGVEATISTPHFLDAMLTPDPELQKAFDAFDGEQLSSARYEDILKSFAEEHGLDMTEGGYTYNSDNDFSQDFVYTIGEDADGEGVVVIRSHNGADARGGFSSPFFARWASPYAPDYFFNWGIEFSDEDGSEQLNSYGVFGVVGEDGEIAEFRSHDDPELVMHPYNPVEGY